MNIYKLPTLVIVAGVEWHIKTDFRDVIDVLENLNNPELDEEEKRLYALIRLVDDFDSLSPDDYTECLQALFDFISVKTDDAPATVEKKKKEYKLMDWAQDGYYLISAVNKVAGVDVRTLDYLHWWTFMSYYMEIDSKSLYATILHIRRKKKEGKAMETWERTFYAENKDLIDLREPMTQEELEEEKLVNELFG